MRDAQIKLFRAAGIPASDAGPGDRLATATSTRHSHTVRGELARNDRPTAGGVKGGEQYIVRDSQNREMPIALSPEMSRDVQVGDKVEAQVDSAGNVTSITKAQ